MEGPPFTLGPLIFLESDGKKQVELFLCAD